MCLGTKFDFKYINFIKWITIKNERNVN